MERTCDTPIMKSQVLPEIVSMILSNASPLEFEAIYSSIADGLGMSNVSREDLSDAISSMCSGKKIDKGESGFSLNLKYIKARFNL